MTTCAYCHQSMLTDSAGLIHDNKARAWHLRCVRKALADYSAILGASQRPDPLTLKQQVRQWLADEPSKEASAPVVQLVDPDGAKYDPVQDPTYPALVEPDPTQGAALMPSDPKAQAVQIAVDPAEVLEVCGPGWVKDGRPYAVACQFEGEPGPARRVVASAVGRTWPEAAQRLAGKLDHMGWVPKARPFAATLPDGSEVIGPTPDGHSISCPKCHTAQDGRCKGFHCMNCGAIL